ncbi:hypothetical protein LTS18_001081 [Coniosporium uncinatum]|uniref:Uncharacterized protein n=1 Tax=Coniosporium uncinatum TaxID=93489 RepID=A0ACC3DCN6_9PEZI|nr:hypothetical protein LTS18_001081 [Coniosporium uncinatum]
MGKLTKTKAEPSAWNLFKRSLRKDGSPADSLIDSDSATSSRRPSPTSTENAPALDVTDQKPDKKQPERKDSKRETSGTRAPPTSPTISLVTAPPLQQMEQVLLDETTRLSDLRQKEDIDKNNPSAPPATTTKPSPPVTPRRLSKPKPTVKVLTDSPDPLSSSSPQPSGGTGQRDFAPQPSSRLSNTGSPSSNAAGTYLNSQIHPSTPAGKPTHLSAPKREETDMSHRTFTPDHDGEPPEPSSTVTKDAPHEYGPHRVVYWPWKRWRCDQCTCETHWENSVCSNLRCVHDRCGECEVLDGGTG